MTYMLGGHYLSYLQNNKQGFTYNYRSTGRTWIIYTRGGNFSH